MRSKCIKVRVKHLNLKIIWSHTSKYFTHKTYILLGPNSLTHSGVVHNPENDWIPAFAGMGVVVNVECFTKLGYAYPGISEWMITND